MVSSHHPMDSPHFLLVFLLLPLFCCFQGGAPDLEADRVALLAFRAAVGRGALPWNASAKPCTWKGVKCDGGRVAELHLPGSGLIGQIPAGTLGNLTALQSVSLRFNALSGPLPPDLAGCKELSRAFLHVNRFSGGIPAGLFSLGKLARLNLASNDFTGGISPSFNNLTRLKTLYLENNRLSGEIPDLDLPNLLQFNVSFNPLNGSIPARLRRMSREAFLGTGLCGGPLGACPDEIPPPSPPSPASPAPAPSRRTNAGGGETSKLSGGAIAGIAVGAAVGLLIVVAVLVILRRRGGGSKTRSVESVAAAGLAQPAESGMAPRDKGAMENGTGSHPPAAAAAASGNAKSLVFLGVGPKVYDLEDLLRASAEVLGKGTTGTTYKAMLEMGMAVAVKRLKDVNLPEKEFRETIGAIGAMDHQNLVPLQAFYYSRDEKLLIYDCMPMGSLSSLLHGNRVSGHTHLDWETRSGIALDVARGIEYIHSMGPGVSHGNIKSSNILLGKSLDAHVAEHGLANLICPSSTPSRAAGYIAPEVTDVRKVSQKGDVYSFGVLVLELLTGKAPVQAFLSEEEGIDLPRWVRSIIQEEWTSEVFDLELRRYQNAKEEMVQLLQLAVDCAAEHPGKRPPMSEVVVRIEEICRSSQASARRNQQQEHHAINGFAGQLSYLTDSIDESRPGFNS